jgi:hypothetical protein
MPQEVAYVYTDRLGHRLARGSLTYCGVSITTANGVTCDGLVALAWHACHICWPGIEVPTVPRKAGRRRRRQASS